MKAKLNKAQAEKMETILDFIKWTKNEFGVDGYIGDNDVTYSVWISNIWNSAAGLKMSGHGYATKGTKVESIDPRDITLIYNAIKRNDDEFETFLKQR